jgi:hypothetical protein
VLRALLGPAEDLQARWDAAPLAVRREVVRALLTGLTLHPRRGRGSAVEDRLTYQWRGEA